MFYFRKNCFLNRCRNITDKFVTYAHQPYHRCWTLIHNTCYIISLLLPGFTLCFMILSVSILLTIRKSVSAFLTINIPSASLAAVANPSVL